MLECQTAEQPTVRSAVAKARFVEPPISYDGPQWFAVMTNPQCEKRAELELTQRGFRVFLPKLRKWVSHARVRKAVERPLLARYLFVEVEHPRQSFGEVKNCNGVESILHNGGVPIVIRREFVADFMRRYLAGEWDYVRQEPCRVEVRPGAWDSEGRLVRAPIVEMRQNPPLPVGARVRVVEGPHEGLLATLTQAKGHKVVAKLLASTQYTKLLALSVRAA